MSQKVFIISGAGSGIGKATALMLGQLGAKVGLLDVRKPTDVAAQIEAGGGQAKAIECDVRSSKEVDQAVKAIVDEYGPIDGAANLAGIMTSNTVGTDEGSLLRTDDEEWDRIITINLNGVKNCLRAELRHANQRGCSIVNAGSVAGQIGSPYNAAYGASKAAIISLTVSVAQEVGRKGIRVNAIAPGIIATPMTDGMNDETKAKWSERNALGRPGNPEEVAKMIWFLLSDESSFCTGTGEDSAA
ncbi:3-oxoacyl-[acyl-carrier-protein] reductase [Lachnellula willkommii]|uniref:3-oxoacyl-[acyl-carrier-protein] reductase n=1 Tax=Lachnellula willkommii TaxID=215461 RepID=A0A559M6Z0_9HELO|nr:3-oxoacyl-[acyl-carrier-protein] reductase [Lachnellula willkommii]